MKTAFISGHLDLTSEEFDEHYLRPIRTAMISGHKFIVGDANGADKITMNYLNNVGEADNVTIFHMFISPRNNPFNRLKTKGGFKTDEERDAAMTDASDYDIAWVRPGREKSGTAKNLMRRSNKTYCGPTCACCGNIENVI